MSWKKQGQNKKNLKVNNLNAVGGHWNYKDSKFYHKNLKFLTIVGIGTSNPFSRLSFGDYSDNLKEGINTRGQILALNETKEGKSGVGIGYYPGNQGIGEGLKLIVGNKDFTINQDNDNVKLYITNNGHFYFNKNPIQGSSNAIVDINGSVLTNSSITIGNSNPLKALGTLKFDKNDVETGLKIKIKNNGNVNDWYNIKLSAQGQKTTAWQSIARTASGAAKQDDIFYNGNIAINYTSSVGLNNTLSIIGNVVVGNNTIIEKTKYTYGQDTALDREGYMLVGKHITINPPTKDYAGETINHQQIKTNVLLNLNLNKNSAGTAEEKINYILGGYNSSMGANSKNNILLGNNSNNTDSDYSFVYGNDIKIEKNEFSFIFGDSNNVLSNRDVTNNIVFGSEQSITDSGNCTIFGYNNTVNNSDSYLMGNNNEISKQDFDDIHFIIGKKNILKDKTNTSARCKGYILGDNNNIISNKNVYATSDCEAIILGDQNKCGINMNMTQQSIIIGRVNTSFHNSFIIGDNNVNNMKVAAAEKIGENAHTTFIIGNNINNTYPFDHASWTTHNKWNDDLDHTKAADLVKIKKQPPLLLVVGQGKKADDKTFDLSSGTFSVDISGNVRCTNIIMNKPTTGLLRCEEVHMKKLFHLKKQIPIHEYVHQFEFRLWKTGDGFIDDKFHIIALPYPGKLIKIISVLNLPNIQSQATTVVGIEKTEPIIYTIKNGASTVNITHIIQAHTIGTVYPKSTIKRTSVSNFNIPKIDPFIEILIDKYQHGWLENDDNWKRLTKVKITLIIDRSA